MEFFWGGKEELVVLSSINIILFPPTLLYKLYLFTTFLYSNFNNSNMRFCQDKGRVWKVQCDSLVEITDQILSALKLTVGILGCILRFLRVIFMSHGILKEMISEKSRDLKCGDLHNFLKNLSSVPQTEFMTSFSQQLRHLCHC